MESLLDVNGAAAALNLSPWTIRAYWRQGKLKGVKIGARLLFEPASILEFIDHCRVQTKNPATKVQDTNTSNEPSSEIER
jgi:hypothetical protein